MTNDNPNATMPFGWSFDVSTQYVGDPDKKLYCVPYYVGIADKSQANEALASFLKIVDGKDITNATPLSSATARAIPLSDRAIVRGHSSMR